MYDLPSRNDVGKCVVDRAVVLDRVNPTLVPLGDPPAKATPQPARRLVARERRRRSPHSPRRSPGWTRTSTSSPPRRAGGRCPRWTASRAGHVLGRPRAGIPTVHVTGTNGKGSTAAMVSALLGAAGLSVGTYTSPNLSRVNERIAATAFPSTTTASPRSSRPWPCSSPAERPAVALRAPDRRRVAVVRRRGGRRHGGRGGAGGYVGLHQRRATATWRWSPTSASTTPRSSADTRGHRPRQGGHRQARQPGRDRGDRPRPGGGDPRGGRAAGAGRDLGARRGVRLHANRLAVGGRLVDLRTPGAPTPRCWCRCAGPTRVTMPLAPSRRPRPSSVRRWLPRWWRRPWARSRCRPDGGGGASPADVCSTARTTWPACEALAAALSEEFATEGDTVAVIGMLRGRDPSAMLDPLARAGVRTVVACAPDSPRALPAEVVAEAARSLGMSVQRGRVGGRGGRGGKKPSPTTVCSSSPARSTW